MLKPWQVCITGFSQPFISFLKIFSHGFLEIPGGFPDFLGSSINKYQNGVATAMKQTIFTEDFIRKIKFHFGKRPETCFNGKQIIVMGRTSEIDGYRPNRKNNSFILH